MSKKEACLELLKRVIIKNQKGKAVYDSGLAPSHSFVIGFLEHIYGEFIDLTVAIEDTSNTSKSVCFPSGGPYPRQDVDASANYSTYGIVVGSGSTAVTANDYALATRIAHGTGAGQLQYGSHSFTSPVVAVGNVDMIVSRTFTNGSGGDVTVREIGIYCRSYEQGISYLYFCIVRDVLPSAITLTSGQTLTIQYTFRTTV